MTFVHTDSALVPSDALDSAKASAPPFRRVANGVAPLLGGDWQWLETRRPYENFAPEHSEFYTIEFLSEGKIRVRADCHIGSGNYAVSDSGRISISPMSAQTYPCDPGSLSTEYMNGLAGTSSYVMSGDTLLIELQAKSGTMRFVRAAS